MINIIDKYYPINSTLLNSEEQEEISALRNILIIHSTLVAQKAVEAAKRHAELHADADFVYEAAMLHDIGIFLTDAPGIHCHGTQPYILHGILGAKLLRDEGLEAHARVAERHTGTGLTRLQIISQNLPLPPRDFVPETIEEQLICWADKFYSKTHPDIEKTTEQAIRSLQKFGPEGVEKFKHWCNLFG